ncbi:MAG: hypothetical protein KKC76_09985 [Proteobacteria bacterium]|nr:hypothetical protein [Pseudomonadota bacterium]MBU4296557.1 hypothetical protein [Pseudomonadota bacterium]MCG2748810.1 hypothetical protein [Desulfobulbaceae bacterium]
MLGHYFMQKGRAVHARHLDVERNDVRPEINPALSDMSSLPEELGEVEAILADAGYYSDSNASAWEKAGIEPFIPPRREKHNQPLASRFAKPGPLPA